jgi:acyl carrier protein
MTVDAATDDAIGLIWEDVLLKRPDGPDEDFFAAGGDSLKAVELEFRIRETFGRDVSIGQVYGACSIRALVELVRTAVDSPSSLPQADDNRIAGTTDCSRLSSGQRSLLQVERLDIGNPLWNIPFRFAIKGVLDPELLRAVLCDIVTRQPALRCTPYSRGNIILGTRLLDQLPIEMESRDFSVEPPATREARLDALSRSLYAAEFNLSDGPLFITNLVRIAPDEHVLIFVAHHLIFDATSARILFLDWFNEYAARANGRRIAVSSYTLAEVPGFSPADLASVTLPAERIPMERYVGGQHHFTIDRELAERLKGSAKTLATGCLTALFRELLEMKQTNRIMVGTSVDIRRAWGLIGMIGCLLRHAELTCEVDDTSTLASIVDQAHAAMGRSMDVSFAQPLGQASQFGWPYTFVFYTEKLNPTEIGGLTFRPLESYPGVAKRDLTLRVFHDLTNGSLACCFDYQACLFSPHEIAALAESFQRTINVIATAPNTPLRDLRV